MPWLRAPKKLEIVAFVTGFITLTFELTAARIVAPYLGTTIYTWTSIIGVILAALAVGYVAGGVWADKRKQVSDIVALLILSAVSISLVTIFKDSVLAELSGIIWNLQAQALVASIILFAAPTIMLGAITPYLARLSITDVATSGHKLSRIEAAGTVGSLAGTFLTGYILFGLIGTRYLLTALALTAVVTSFLLHYKKQVLARLGLLLLIILAGVFASKPPILGLVQDIDTKYGRIAIRDTMYEGQSVRVLQTDRTYQSGVYKDGDSNLIFRYTRAFSYASELRPESKRHLIIGGGAFTFPAFLAREFPESTVDTIEIDDQLPAISKEYFMFNQPTNLNIIAADGRQFLNNSARTYDLIFLDAFNSSVPPFQLLTREAAREMQRSLAQDGLAIANIIAASEGHGRKLIEYVYSTYKSVFRDVSVYRVDPEMSPITPQNLLIIAGNTQPNGALLAKIRQSHPEFKQMLRAKLDLPYSPRHVMTDDYAPVEALVL